MTQVKRMLVAIGAVFVLFTGNAVAGGDIAPVETIQVSEVVVQEQDFYIGLNTALASGTEFDNIKWFDRTTIGVQAGWVAYRNERFSTALEVRYSTDANDFGDVATLTGFVKPAYDLDGASVYGLVGYGDVMTDNVDFGDNAGLVYGAGVSTPFAFGTEVFVDYTRNDEFQADTVTLGLNYKF